MHAYNARSALVELVEPTLKRLAELGIPDTQEARTALLAIGGQESGWWGRTQKGGGPARGLWQFEKYGGVRGVLEHWSTRKLAHQVCEDQWTDADPALVHDALATNDLLACAFARLLIWTDPFMIPLDQAGMWRLYMRTWRPGKPREHHWPQNFYVARFEVEARAKRRPLELFSTAS